MFKILKADKDTYITNRIVDLKQKVASNVGQAGTLDLYKLYEQTSGSIELSRLLIHFNLEEIFKLHQENKIDINNPSFFAKLKLHDVYGGQTTPENYTIVINPLSASFFEGFGKDITLYSDIDTSNYLSGSDSPWNSEGCMLSGSDTDICDFITGSNGNNLTISKFINFDEDLEVDITPILSATLAHQIPDSGFRIAFSNTHEQDNKTYFVKRFCSRQAFDSTKHPKLLIGFDDSIQDDSRRLFFNEDSNIFLYNRKGNTFANLKSSSAEITGSNSILLRLETAISGGFASYYFTGSQHQVGSVIYPGIYSASINLSSADIHLSQKLLLSKSINFTPIWTSLDETVVFSTGSNVSVSNSDINSVFSNYNYIVTVNNLKSSMHIAESTLVRLNIFDNNSPNIIAQRLPIILPSIVIRDVHFAVRDVANNVYVIPFDSENNSTRVSSDYNGMYFKIDASSLISGRSYTIDIQITTSNKELYQSVSPIFTIHN